MIEFDAEERVDAVMTRVRATVIAICAPIGDSRVASSHGHRMLFVVCERHSRTGKVLARSLDYFEGVDVFVWTLNSDSDKIYYLHKIS